MDGQQTAAKRVSLNHEREARAVNGWPMLVADRLLPRGGRPLHRGGRAERSRPAGHQRRVGHGRPRHRDADRRDVRVARLLHPGAERDPGAGALRCLPRHGAARRLPLGQPLLLQRPGSEDVVRGAAREAAAAAGAKKGAQARVRASTRATRCRCGPAPSTVRGSRSTTSAATRSRSPPSSSGACTTPPRPSSTSTTTRSTCETQSETALRHLASSYAYDHGEENEVTLRSNVDEVSEALKDELRAAPGPSRRGGRRGPSDPPGLRPGDRPGHAAASAGRSRHRRPPEDRARCRQHGRHGPPANSPRSTSSPSTTSARPPWSATSWWCSAANPRCIRWSTRVPCTPEALA